MKQHSLFPQALRFETVKQIHKCQLEVVLLRCDAPLKGNEHHIG